LKIVFDTVRTCESIHGHETDLRRIHYHFAGAIVIFYGILFCFGVYKYSIYFQMLPKKNYLVVKSG